MRLSGIFCLFLVIFISNAYSETFQFNDGTSRDGKLVGYEQSHVKLNLKQYPYHDFPVFIYNDFSYNIRSIRQVEKIKQADLLKSKDLLEKGNNFFYRKDYLNAIEYYERSLKINDEYVYAYHNIAVAWLMVREYNKSIAAFRHLLRLYPESEYAYIYLTLNYIHIEQYKRAKDTIAMAKRSSVLMGNNEYARLIERLDRQIKEKTFP